MDRCQIERENTRYLPGVSFPGNLWVQPDFARAVESNDLVVVVPSSGFRQTLEQLQTYHHAERRVAWATKGFELETGLLPHQVFESVLGTAIPCAVLSGPTFATEVGLGLPTALTVASSFHSFAQDLAKSLSTGHFRAYTSSDLIGVEVGGAVKNVIAIATGLADGMGFGANTRAALITRGLAEMTRLGVALGAAPETFMGLAALGDLVLSCTDNQSRNRRFGLLIATGHSSAEAASTIGQVVEGIRASSAVLRVAETQGVDMPICAQVYAVLHEHKSLKEAVASLTERELKTETGHLAAGT